VQAARSAGLRFREKGGEGWSGRVWCSVEGVVAVRWQVCAVVNFMVPAAQEVRQAAAFSGVASHTRLSAPPLPGGVGGVYVASARACTNGAVYACSGTLLTENENGQ